MAARKMVRPMLELAHLGHRATTCHFSSASRALKKAKIGMAPKVRKAIRTSGSSPSKTTNSTGQDDHNLASPLASFKPSTKAVFVSLLQSAFVSQVVPLDGENLFQFLCQYQELVINNKSLAIILVFCKECNMTPLNLYHLSKILGNVSGQERFARRIMVDAAEFGEPLATCELVEAGIRGNSFDHPEFHGNLRRLQGMAESAYSPNQRAMATLGNYYMSQQKYREAMRMLTNATDRGMDSGAAAQAYFNMGKIYLIWKDKDGAYGALRKAAEGSHPEALYYLATAAEEGSDCQKSAYQVAALTGIHEASHNLGDIELETIESRPEKPKTMLDYGMAREWFQVAATDGFIPSILNMALLCKSVGEKETGMAWLESAEKWLEKKSSQEFRNRAEQVRNNWNNQDIEVTAVNSGYCGKIDPFIEVRAA